MVESEIGKAPDLSSGGDGHGGVLGFSPNPRRYDEMMASKLNRRTGNRHYYYNFGYWIQIPTQKFITANITYRLVRLERHRLLFDELVLGQDQLLRGCYFLGGLRRRDGARVRSFAES